MNNNFNKVSKTIFLKSFQTLWLLLCLILVFPSNAQISTKGLSPVAKSVLNEGDTYALVVGISDYQDDGIPDLRFADKDAEAFATFLKSPAGGELDQDHLKVLINEKATAGNIASALYWLVEKSKKDDRILIYFSGHGDVEGKLKGQPGFLLCWDAPPKIYMAGGTIQVGLLQTVISTLSVDNEAKVTIITDACRSGKLAGSDTNGSQLTNANLSQQFANEIKILSCQPDELSIEGEQWGGGRGAFSYHLIEGLYGLADANGDMNVSLLEISRFLEDRIPTEVAPQSQMPMTVGSRTEILTKVFPELLEKVKNGEDILTEASQEEEISEAVKSVLATADENMKKTYFDFKEALNERRFLQPKESCADTYYELLVADSNFESIHSDLRLEYAAALQNDVQQVLNKIVKAKGNPAVKPELTEDQAGRDYPMYIKRAAGLLGPDHYMYDILLARSFWFKLLKVGQRGE